MKTLLRRTLLFAALVAVVAIALPGCSRPKTIPDEKLERIFEEIFLANAYYNTIGGIPAVDSIDMYRPILKKYGYKVGDLAFTIQNYSKRKSSRISDLVEKTIARLEKGEQSYSQVVARRDSIDSKARERFSTSVYYDSNIVVTRIADTARLHIEIPVKPGEYVVTYSYLIDSLDRNGGSRSLYELMNDVKYVTNRESHGLTQRRRATHSQSIIPMENDRTLSMKLLGYSPDMDRPHVRIDSIRIVYMPPMAAARDSLFNYYIRQVYSLPENLARKPFDYGTKDSGPRTPDSPGIAQGRDADN